MNTQKKFLPNIGLCIMMDLMGMLTFAIPAFGEFADVIWAPLSALIFYKMFGGRTGIFGGFFNFLEEAFPFTDIIPTFTIAWFIRKKEIEYTSYRKVA